MLQLYLMNRPDAGDIIKGSGGVRKLRWGLQGTGKRGGVRVIYYFHNRGMPLYLLEVFGKNEKANLTGAEKNVLKSLVSELVKWGYKDNE